MDVPEPPPPPPAPSDDVTLRPSSARLVLGGVLGALVASGIAVLVALQLAKPDIPASALATSPSPTDAGHAMGSVEGLRAGQPRWSADPKTWRVTLEWQAVDGAVRYVISRDGRRIGDVETPDFVDVDVTPDDRYRYEVVAVDDGGNRSEAARTSLRTDELPKDAARVQGRWLLKLKVQSSTIGADGFQAVVTLSPTCRRGPCDVTWDFARVGNAGTARRDGAAYEGTGSGSFFTLGCHGETISSSVSLSFRVEKARTVGSAWRATSISGTITESVASFSNCLSARNVWTFDGAAQG